MKKNLSIQKSHVSRLSRVTISFLLSAFCFLPHSSALAQNSFPTSNAIWNYKVTASDWFSGKQGERNVYYTICGTDTINDIVYSKLYTTFDTIICGENLGQFLGYFRQNGEKIYFLPYVYYFEPGYGWRSEFGSEFLLYDFGLSIGETIDLDYGFYYRFWNNDKIKHEFIEQYKRLIVNNIYIVNGKKVIDLGEDIWYEGIGSIFGLFHKGMPALDGYSFGFILNCFKYNDTVKYLNNSDCNKCFCKNYVDIKEHIKDFDNINIYPNPTTGELRIMNYELRNATPIGVSSAKIIMNYELQLFDATGRMQNAECKMQNGKIVIDISHIQSGIYFLKIDNQTFKIIKN